MSFLKEVASFLGFKCLIWIACLKYFLGFLGLFNVWFGRFGLVSWDLAGLSDDTYQIGGL
jgi:hypothetical protein